MENHQYKNILPLLGNPVIKKRNMDQIKNKYNSESLSPQNKLNKKIITFNQILGFYLKTLNIYKNKLSNYTLKNPKLSTNLHDNKISNTFLIEKESKNIPNHSTNSNINFLQQNSLNNSINKEVINTNMQYINDNFKDTINYQPLNNNLLLNDNKLNQNKNIIKANQVKINQTNKYLNKIDRNEKFNYNNHSITSINSIIPVNFSKFTNNLTLQPIINQYIKSMSIFNMINKGILINYNKIVGYNFYKGPLGKIGFIPAGKGGNTNKLKKNIYEFLSASFYSMYCLISKPIFIITPEKVSIQLFYYLFIPNLFKYKVRNIKKFRRIYYRKLRGYYQRKRNKFNYKYTNLYKYRQLKKYQRIIFRKLSTINLLYLYPRKFKIICIILSRLFKKPVELDLIRLHYPYNDSNILVNLLAIMINKIKIRIIIRKLFRKAIIKNPNKIDRNKKVTVLPAFLSGVKIKIAGRLLTHKVIPRKTVKTIRRGAISRGKINFSDVARLSQKNKRGAFSITVSSGQNFL